MNVVKDAMKKIKLWRKDPVQFVRDVFHVEPDAWQKEVLEAFGDPGQKRISEQACAGPGKSAALAWCGWNFMMCYAEVGHHPNCAAMSVSRDNLRDNLWKEFAVWRGRSKLLQETFEWTKERIFSRDHPETWFISARSWAKSADAETQGRTLSGLHSKYVLYLIDESGDINPSVLKAAEQGLSNCKWGKILQAGNPTSQTGILFAAASTQRHLWTVVRVTGDPEDPRRSPRIDKEWAREQIKLYGRENPWVMAYILGQFPPTALNSLLSVEEVEAAMNRDPAEDDYSTAQKRMGIDAARFGDDPWVIFPRQGLQAFTPVEMRNPRTHEVAARVAKAKKSWGSEMEFFDDTGGYAGGAIDSLLQAGHNPIAISFSGKATDPRFFNKRAEMWFEMADWVKRGGALPEVAFLVAELTTPTYTFKNGKFIIEEKEQVKKRLGRSPNYADALGLTFAYPDMPTAAGLPQFMQDRLAAGSHQADYDPFERARREVMA